MRWSDKYAALVKRTVTLDRADFMDLLRKRDMVPLNMVFKSIEFDEDTREVTIELEQETPVKKP